jgi:putative molybdopterin biosynthesis protein
VSRAAELVTGTRLRLARQARGLSQQQLAGMAGVTRQAVSAVESGQSDPSLRVALALAQALGMTLDELFGAEGAIPAVTASLVGTPRQPQRVTLAPMADSFVALPLAGPTVSRAGFLPAGGLVTGPAGPGEPGQVRVRPIGPPKPTLVAAGCDPALPLLAEPLSLLDPPVGFSWWPCASQEAIRLARAGLVHVAGVHLSGQPGMSKEAGQPAPGQPAPGQPAPGQLAAGSEIIGFSAWREGLVLRQAEAGRVAGLGDVIDAGLRLVNREPGAEARSVLDRELASLGIAGGQVPGYETRATGHLQVAEAVATGLADAGVASEPAALAYGLAFLPLAAERFDLVIPASQSASREVQALVKVLSSRWLLDQLGSLPGYDPSPCGQHVSLS